MKKIFIILGLLFCFIQPVFSASTIIKNYTPEELKTTLMKVYIKNGANIKNANEYQLIADEKGSFLTNAFMGTSFNRYVTIRTTYNFVKDGYNTIMNVNMEQVVNPNSAFENAMPFNDKMLQPIVDLIEKALNGYYGYGFNYKKKGKYLIILAVDKNTPDLNINDKIYKINNTLVKKMSKSQIKNKLNANDDDSEITFNLLRNKQEKEVKLKSRFIEPTITK